jgi:hypothetical protein
MMASQNDRRELGRIGPEPIEPVSMIEQGDPVTLSMKMVCGCETGQAGTENKDAV